MLGKVKYIKALVADCKKDILSYANRIDGDYAYLRLFGRIASVELKFEHTVMEEKDFYYEKNIVEDLKEYDE